MRSLYEYADQKLPESVPDRPAEVVYDVGRGRWQELLERDDVWYEQDEDSLVVHFPEAMQTELHRYQRGIPMEIQAEKRGLDIVIRMSEAFDDWLGPIESESDGIFRRLRDMIYG